MKVKICIYYSMKRIITTLLDCPDVRELTRGDVGPISGRVGVSPWSGLPSNRILYVSFSVLSYSSIFFHKFSSAGLHVSIGDLEEFSLNSDFGWIVIFRTGVIVCCPVRLDSCFLRDISLLDQINVSRLDRLGVLNGCF